MKHFFSKFSTFIILFNLGCLGCATRKPINSNSVLSSKFCKPNQDYWPKPDQWRLFNVKITGKLEMPQSPLLPCTIDSKSDSCKAAIKQLKNPFFIADQPGGIQFVGWLDAWSGSPSSYAVSVENSNDNVEAVNFARKHRLKLVIKGIGHDYLGRSNAPDSLLIWTNKMRQVEMQKGFVPQGCAKSYPKIPAVTIGAGARWLDVYQMVAVKLGRYVQGGGCNTVGAVGGLYVSRRDIDSFIPVLQARLEGKP